MSVGISKLLRMIALPDARGHFGRFGGTFVPEVLHAALAELDTEFRAAQVDPAFRTELAGLQCNYAGRPTPMTVAENPSKHCGNATIFLKRGDLNHTDAYKINNAFGRVLFIKRMGKTRVIAEIGAGQYGVATAMAIALLGLECYIYMGQLDTERQALNVARMQLLGAEVHAVASSSRILKDAMNEAMRDWVPSVENTHYLLGTVDGPHPFPYLVRELRRVISTEARAQMLEEHGDLPDWVVMAASGGSNATGALADFIPDGSVHPLGIEAAGEGIETERHAAKIGAGRPGVLHGARTFMLQTEDGQTMELHPISAGFDYPRVGPEHAWLAEAGRAGYESATDVEVMDTFQLLTRTEGIIPAIESARVIADARRLALKSAEERPEARPRILARLSGRGDKDASTAFGWFGMSGEPDRVVGEME